MNASSLFWLIKRIKKRIPALVLMVMAQIGQALFLVYFCQEPLVFLEGLRYAFEAVRTAVV